MDNKKLVEYWLKIAEHDFETIEHATRTLNLNFIKFAPKSLRPVTKIK